MGKLLTVVVPIYKVEKYIKKCLDSLVVPVKQMDKLEVICINDGTPDNSALIAKEFEKSFPNVFKVIDKENGGHGSTWNKGIELAKGKYLRFLDSDDWLTNLSEFMFRLGKYDVDMVFTDLQNVHESNKKRDCLYSCKSAMNPDVVYDAEEYDWRRTKNLHNGFNATNFHTCTYRTEILKRFNPVFLEKMYYDDEILCVLPLCVSKNFVYIDLTIYNYLKGRSGQTTDPNVLMKNISFKERILKYQVNFYQANKPQSSKLDEKIKSVLNSRIVNIFKLMALHSLNDSLPMMKDLHLWLMRNYLEYDGSISINLYKISPTMFWIVYHTFIHIVRRWLNRFLKWRRFMSMRKYLYQTWNMGLQ